MSTTDINKALRPSYGSLTNIMKSAPLFSMNEYFHVYPMDAEFYTSREGRIITTSFTNLKVNRCPGRIDILQGQGGDAITRQWNGYGQKNTRLIDREDYKKFRTKFGFSGTKSLIRVHFVEYPFLVPDVDSTSYSVLLDEITDIKTELKNYASIPRKKDKKKRQITEFESILSKTFNQFLIPGRKLLDCLSRSLHIR